jgi:hypothetical protein
VESLTLYPAMGFEILFGPIPWVLQTALSDEGRIKRHSFHQIQNDANIKKKPKHQNNTLREMLNEVKREKIGHVRTQG